jgi:nitroimidazol reductase NimA-like FMN-containing flavoprotein (pyridoxamine 5'-phosphate oxidase superfamily)
VPTAEKLVLPKDYGKTTGVMAWEDVRAKLTEAKQYWLATNRPTGSPHLVPVDGMWVDDVWYYGGSPETTHRRLAAKDPQVTMHLADPWQVVIVEGEVRVTEQTEERAAELAATANAKYTEYGYDFPVEWYRKATGLHPRRVLAWSEFPKDATRFTFT